MSLVRICPRDPSRCVKKEIYSSGKNKRGTVKYVTSFISLLQSFSLIPSNNTFISASQGPGDKVTPKIHHPKAFWSSRDSLTNHLTPFCACTHTYPCVLGPLHSYMSNEMSAAKLRNTNRKDSRTKDDVKEICETMYQYQN